MFLLIARKVSNMLVYVSLCRYEGWIAGYQAAYDTAKSKLIANNFALGYRANDFNIHSSV